MTVLTSAMPLVKFALLRLLSEASEGKFLYTFMLHFLEKACCYEHRPDFNFYRESPKLFISSVNECFTPCPELTLHTEKKKKTHLLCLQRCLNMYHS